jgi:hypothetical protein
MGSAAKLAGDPDVFDHFAWLPMLYITGLKYR